MYFRIIIYLLASSFAALTAKASRLASRQLDCGIEPVDCGDGWCCMMGEQCQASSATETGAPYICLDVFLTQSDGTTLTEDAINPASESAAWASITSFLSFSPTSLVSTTTTAKIASTTPTTTSKLSSATISTKASATSLATQTTAATATVATTSRNSSASLESPIWRGFWGLPVLFLALF